MTLDSIRATSERASYRALSIQWPRATAFSKSLVLTTLSEAEGAAVSSPWNSNSTQSRTEC